MPIVNIQVTREGSRPGATSVTSQEKAALIKGVSELLRDVLNKPLESTFVVIEEVDPENWAGADCLPSNIAAARWRPSETLHQASGG